MRIIIGSRGSALALWQASWVRDQLAAAGHSVEVKVIKTTGDRLLSASLVQSGSKGLFIKEIEEALEAGAVDLAVHSLKDLPIEQPAGLCVLAVPKREDARDAFVSGDGKAFAQLPPGARVGTSSLRRQSQLVHARPDLKVVPLRGNVDTRLKKLERGECDAVVLAAAGLLRLGLKGRVTHFFSVAEMCPAVGQGALAIEARQADAAIEAATKPLDDRAAHRAVRAERSMLLHLGGGCSVPIAAHAFEDGGRLRLIGVVASPDGRRLIRASGEGAAGDPEELGRWVAMDLVKQGARGILQGESAPAVPEGNPL